MFTLIKHQENTLDTIPKLGKYPINPLNTSLNNPNRSKD